MPGWHFRKADLLGSALSSFGLLLRLVGEVAAVIIIHVLLLSSPSNVEARTDGIVAGSASNKTTFFVLVAVRV